MTDDIRWEYRVESIGFALRGPKDHELAAVLNTWGTEGWEVFAVEFPSGSTKVKVIARRPLTRSSSRQRSWPG